MTIQKNELVFSASYLLYTEIPGTGTAADMYTITTTRCCFEHMVQALVDYIVETHGIDAQFDILSISTVDIYTDLGANPGDDDKYDDRGDNGNDGGDDDDNNDGGDDAPLKESNEDKNLHITDEEKELIEKTIRSLNIPRNNKHID